MRTLQDTLSHACMTSARKKYVFLKVGFRPHYLPYTHYMANRKFSFENKCKFKSSKKRIKTTSVLLRFFLLVFNATSIKIGIIF
jgi:hypothetical protein